MNITRDNCLISCDVIPMGDTQDPGTIVAYSCRAKTRVPVFSIISGTSGLNSVHVCYSMRFMYCQKEGGKWFVFMYEGTINNWSN